MSPLLETRDLSVRIGGQRVCDSLELRIGHGECWALLGRNGTGKTTLLHHLAGLRRDHSGDILSAGQDLAQLSARSRAQRIGILLQHSNRGFGADVFDTVLSGRHPHLSGLGWETAADVDIARHCVKALGLGHLAQRSLQTLSGGELRRVEIARLLAQQTPLSLLDEPTNHLDLAHQADCIRTLRRQCVSDKRAMLLVVHDLNLAYRVCDHWLILDGDGHWQAGTRESLSDRKRLSTAYAHPISRIESDNGPVFLADL
jgi:iron complex transport system ATP-binding protein